VDKHKQESCPVNVKVAIVTASDRSFRGEREDLSGPAIRERVEALGWEVVCCGVVPDEKEKLKEEMIRIADRERVPLLLTTGGTGLAPRDSTPDATLEVIEKQVPGIAEAMRQESLKKTRHAMLSRAVCGVRGQTLIINLPGSPKAVHECLDVVIPVIPHALELLQGSVSDCQVLQGPPESDD